jgi:hypothetical protein
MLLAKNDPRESLMRFHVLRQSFFDYPALDVRRVSDGQAAIAISYQMGPVAEEAASLQTMGFFERLLELAGSPNVLAKFETKSWEGAKETLLALKWR